MRRLLLLASAIVFVDTAFFAAITPLLPRYVDDLGISKTAAGLLAAAYPAACSSARCRAAGWPRRPACGRRRCSGWP